MRPLKLTIRAMGPYVGEQTVDFRELGDRSLFLIHGPTGSGKTSILDALTFALYGECSGEDREVKRIRSDHADAWELTEVTLDFRIGRDDYRVYRVPEQPRPKKRSDGTTLGRAKAVLWRRTGLVDDTEEGTVLAAKWNDVTAGVEQLLGFRSDQFRQVVLLPQGQFRRLLLSDSRERQAILEVLFSTEVYRRIEEALKKASRALEADIRDAGQRLKLVLDQAGTDSADALVQELDLARGRLVSVGNDLTTLKAKEKSGQEDLLRARQVAEKIQERDRSLEHLARLEAKMEAFDRMRDLLNVARKAATLQGEERALDQRIKEAQDAADRLDAARKAMDIAATRVKSAQELFHRENGRRLELDEARQNQSRLEQLTGNVKQLDEASKRLIEAQAGLAEAATGLEAAIQAFGKYPILMEENLKALQETEKTADQLELLRLKSSEMGKAYTNRIRLSELDVQYSALAARLQEASDRLAKADHTLASASRDLETLENAWIEGQAAILAQNLRTGNPCPVCGSREHPTPATSDRPLPTDRAVKTKRTLVNQLKDELEESGRQKATLEKNIGENRASARELKEGLGDLADRDAHDIELALKKLKRELDRAVAAHSRLDRLKEESKRLEQAFSQARERRDQAEKLKHDAISKEQAARAEVTARQAGIPDDLQELPALVRAQQKASRKVRDMEQALEKAQTELALHREALASCQASLEAAREARAHTANAVLNHREAFQKSMHAAGFPDEPLFREAKKAVPNIERMDNDLRDFDADLNAARDRMKRAAEAAHGLSMPDLDAMESAVHAVKSEIEKALREEASISEKIKRREALLVDYRKWTGELEALDARYAVVGRISEVANGQNPHGITFQRFVLAALLDDVLIAATQRLQIMSHRRYSLQRRGERSDRRVAGGLDLEVMDSYTGVARPVSTLSGGESFLASLSLALGLSDVVQAYAGGIHLDTIFVDEGFGSLDPEALDLAFRALMDLQQGGRLVGIISHVPDLRERIDTRLEVTPDHRGSTARFVLG